MTAIGGVKLRGGGTEQKGNNDYISVVIAGGEGCIRGLNSNGKNTIKIKSKTKN